MSLLEQILKAKSQEPPCNDCGHLIFPKENLSFCKVKDKILLPNFPPNKCDLREERGFINGKG